MASSVGAGRLEFLTQHDVRIIVVVEGSAASQVSRVLDALGRWRPELESLFTAVADDVEAPEPEAEGRPRASGTVVSNELLVRGDSVGLENTAAARVAGIVPHPQLGRSGRTGNLSGGQVVPLFVHTSFGGPTISNERLVRARQIGENARPKLASTSRTVPPSPKLDVRNRYYVVLRTAVAEDRTMIFDTLHDIPRTIDGNNYLKRGLQSAIEIAGMLHHDVVFHGFPSLMECHSYITGAGRNWLEAEDWRASFPA